MKRALLLAAITFAVAAPAPAATDARVKTVSYGAGDVVPLVGHYGYQMMIALEPSERIQNVSIGDSVAWLVTPAKDAGALFIKPVEANASTNMTVLTDRRTYLFELSAARARQGGRTPGMTYKVQFRYPEQAAQAAAAARAQAVRPAAYNRSYALSGSKTIRPTAVFDDGRFTYFAFPPNAEIPAIFLLDGRKEALANHATRDGYVVLDRVARALVLRQGKERVKVKNRGYGKPIMPAVTAAPARPAGAKVADGRSGGKR